MTKIKIAVLGKAVSGKSSLTYRFINYNTPTDHDATIEDKYKTVVDFEGLTCEIGVYKFKLINKIYYRNSGYRGAGRLPEYA